MSTLEHAELKGFDIGTWFGVLAPAGTPQEIVARLNSAIVQAPDFRKRMAEMGAKSIGNSPGQMARQISLSGPWRARLLDRHSGGPSPARRI